VLSSGFRRTWQQMTGRLERFPALGRADAALMLEAE
jgi:hypothetical protein